MVEAQLSLLIMHRPHLDLIHNKIKILQIYSVHSISHYHKASLKFKLEGHLLHLSKIKIHFLLVYLNQALLEILILFRHKTPQSLLKAAVFQQAGTMTFLTYWISQIISNNNLKSNLSVEIQMIFLVKYPLAKVSKIQALTNLLNLSLN
jgi:hypothetical protein